MQRKPKKKRWEDYEVVDMPDVVTFGTTLFMRKDKLALRIVFPSGEIVTFAPVGDGEDICNGTK